MKQIVEWVVVFVLGFMVGAFMSQRIVDLRLKIVDVRPKNYAIAWPTNSITVASNITLTVPTNSIWMESVFFIDDSGGANYWISNVIIAPDLPPEPYREGRGNRVQFKRLEP